MNNEKNSRYHFAHRWVPWLERALNRVISFLLRRLPPHLSSIARDYRMRRRISGFVGPTDNERLSDAEFARAKAVCGDIKSLIAGRMRYIEENSLDAEFCLPGANWKGYLEKSTLFNGTAALLREDYEVINNLRLFSQAFTGYSLLEMGPAQGIVSPESVPPDLAERKLQASGRIDEWVGRYWDLSRYLPNFLRISQPDRFGEAGWRFSGRLINHDAYVYLERIALLDACGQLERISNGTAGRNPVILEIGGGFGGLAYHLRKLAMSVRYIIVDLPEALAFSALYLTTLFPEQHNVIATSPGLIAKDVDRPGFTFVPNYFCHRFEESGIEIDLAINTLSMSEMPARQVTAYCEMIRRSLAPDGVFFEQNQDNRHLGMINAEDLISGIFPGRRRLSLPTGTVCGSPNVWQA